jgi:uncharacterized protein
VDEIRTHAQLRDALGGPPNCGTMNTIRRTLEPIDEQWLSRSSFCFMATEGHGGADCSPRGDVPGFVSVLNSQTIVLPERPGNHRGDGYHNLLENPFIGLCFLIPPASVMLRINGRATMVRAAPIDLYISIDEVFYHCVKAVERSGFFDPNAWRDDAPTRAEITKALRNEGEV